MNLSSIREKMKVVGSDRQPVGTVDHIEGDEIKLAKNDPQANGQSPLHPLRLDRRGGRRPGAAEQELERSVLGVARRLSPHPA